MNRLSFASRFSICVAGVALAATGAAFTLPAAQAATIYSYTENFEDGLLNTPGVTASGGSVLGPGLLTDSVEGANPGFGSNGFSYYSAGSKKLTFTFSKAVLGVLPTTAGLTWTDIGFVDDNSYPVGTGNVIFRAFSESNGLLTQISRVLGDGLFAGQTAEDSIFSYKDLTGIGSIEIEIPNSGDWEIDDLQYSAAVPTPALLPGLIGLGLGMWRKRKGDQAEQAS